MRPVSNLLELFKRPCKNDPVFGSMRYTGSRTKYWECKIVFPPTSSVIEAFIDGSIEDNMEKQHMFFDQIVRLWPMLEESIGKALLKEWLDENPDMPIESPWNIFRLTSLSIPAEHLSDATWELSFAALKDIDSLWTVRMVGTRPQGVGKDD